VKSHFVDATIILCYLTKDDPDRASACFVLFSQAAQDKTIITTTASVIAEVVYVLASKQGYQLTPGEIKKRLLPLLSLRSLKLDQRQIVLRALALFELYELDFEAWLSVAHMERQQFNEIYSYDPAFDQVKNIQRRKP
jgi:predicted nucleic acid-binding protein